MLYKRFAIAMLVIAPLLVMLLDSFVNRPKNAQPAPVQSAPMASNAMAAAAPPPATNEASGNATAAIDPTAPLAGAGQPMTSATGMAAIGMNPMATAGAPMVNPVGITTNGAAATPNSAVKAMTPTPNIKFAAPTPSPFVPRQFNGQPMMSGGPTPHTQQ